MISQLYLPTLLPCISQPLILKMTLQKGKDRVSHSSYSFQFILSVCGFLVVVVVVVLGHTGQHTVTQFPNQGSNQCSLHWERRVLTTGPPRKSPFQFILTLQLANSRRCWYTTYESRIEVKITESASCRRRSTVLVRTKYIHVHELPNTPCAISMIPHANEVILNLHLKLEMQNINGIIHTSDLNSVFT